jgi:hypothetical protein
VGDAPITGVLTTSGRSAVHGHEIDKARDRSFTAGSRSRACTAGVSTRLACKAGVSRRVAVYYTATLALLGAFVELAAVGAGAAGQLTYYGVEIAAAAGAIVGALRRHEERRAWLLLAAGVTLFVVGDVYWQLRYGSFNGPNVSLADVFYLSCYACVLASVIILIWARMGATTSATVWLDGVISGLAAGALCAALTFGEVVSLTGGPPLSVALNVAYPVADLIVGSLVVAIIGVHGWRLDAAWLWLLAGLLIFAVGDSAYLYQDAAGTYVNGGILDALWPLALLLISFAGWQPAGQDRFVADERHGVALPTALGASRCCCSSMTISFASMSSR